MIKVKLAEGTITIPQGTTLLEISRAVESSDKVVAAHVNNRLCSLQHQLTVTSKVQFLGLNSDEGMRIYRDSLVFVLAKATREVLPNSRLKIEHSLSNGLYGEIKAEHPLVEDDVAKIEQRMLELVLEDQPLIQQRMTLAAARNIFLEQGFHDKVRLLEQLDLEQVTTHSCDSYYDTISDVLVPSTGYLSLFKLRFYLPGFILEYPKKENPLEIPEYVEQGKLANVFYDTEKWGKNIGVSDVVELNKLVEENCVDDLIRIAEANHEKQIAKIADKIAADRDRLRVILIAGPSSSGKTTFAQRLSIQLRINQLHPVSISLDDYFVDRDRTPIDEDGNYDFETLEAIDIKLFNYHLAKLIQGESINLPTFNFIEGRREWGDKILKVGADQPIIIEGIHGLNDKLTTAIPQGRKFKIYVSALTQINIDDHTRIPTTDVRLIRRIIRDNQFRSHSAADTIDRWPSVRRGEELHIFPFQEDADVMFNSAIDYELAVLKTHAEPLLMEITDQELAFAQAQRLLNFLSYFKKLPNEDGIPCNSILLEFLGGSCFDK